MTRINEHYRQLSGSYLFSEIAQKVHACQEANPSAGIIRLGIGDITQPLAPAVIRAMHRAVDEMAHPNTMRGYAPETGYPFLQKAILENDFEPRGIHLRPDEIFISDGAKSDTANISDIFSPDNTVALTDPVYPVYLDTNIMAGRAGDGQNGSRQQILYLPATPENNFTPQLPVTPVDLIYLCYPNNPTGTTLTQSQLRKWVDYALENQAILLFDAAYEAFITERDIPHSIYEIEGARQTAIEFRSFSKTAGFTGVRCGYTVVPQEVTARDAGGRMVSLNALWRRRQTTKFNGTAYIVQRAAEAVCTPEGREQIQATIRYYMQNARIIRESLEKTGLTVYGGVNAPYLWVKTPDGISSWEYFDRLLNRLQIVTTPGVGFGKSGEGFIRLTAFGNREEVLEAMERFRQRGDLR